MYRIREVDAQDEETADTLADLHRLTFLGTAPMPPFEWGHWWLAFCGGSPVAFAGLVPSTHIDNAGYFCRVGVVDRHWGRSLQLRLMRAMEGRARHNGWSCIVSDTTENLPSANNFIKAGYRLYQPQHPWGWSHTLYWRKQISREGG
jgi:GNAT superfamily N-acetyltransferase